MDRVRAIQQARDARKIRDATPTPSIVELNGQYFRVLQLEDGAIRLIRIDGSDPALVPD